MHQPHPLARAASAACLFLIATAAHAQQPAMPGMPMPPADTMPMAPGMSMKPPTTLIANEEEHTSSGTSIEPDSTPMAMLMAPHHYGGWRLMLHGTASISDIQQHATATPSAPPQALCTELDSACAASYRRGGDKLFSTNWIMPMAQHRLGRGGELTVRAMLSLEPGTITGEQFPELFQQGETAYGKPILDGQHPHDFVMELAALYDLHLSEHTLLSLYAAPVGDPAIGPTAYPHRLSASEDPLAALGHHQEDSTHIAFNVLTAGITQGRFRVELSGFHGAEPTEARWHFQPSPNGLTPDSVATRITYSPTQNVAAQYSIAHITSPEQLQPGQDQQRQTASVMFNRSVGAHHDTTSMPGMDMGSPASGNWANTLLWGHTRNLATGVVENSYLLESLLNFHHQNYIWTRIESAARTTELLDLMPLDPAAPIPEQNAGHVQAFSLGYDRDLHQTFAPHLAIAPGAQFTVYHAPDALASTYGRAPFSAVLFLRMRLR